ITCTDGRWFEVLQAAWLGTGPAPGGRVLLVDSYLWHAKPICLRLFSHLARAAASRTFCTAGSSRPMRMAIMAITTNSSIKVKPRRFAFMHELQFQDQSAKVVRAHASSFGTTCAKGRRGIMRVKRRASTATYSGARVPTCRLFPFLVLSSRMRL